MRARIILASVALLVLTGCGAGSPSAEPSSESAEDRNKSVAACGVMGKMLSGEIDISANFEEAQETLKAFAENGPGEVKSTAQYVLDEIDGKEHTEAESEEQIEKFKSYCSNYTVD